MRKKKTPQPPCYFYTHHWTYLETKYTSSTKISTFVTFTMNWNIEHIFWKIYSKDHINTGFLTEGHTERKTFLSCLLLKISCFTKSGLDEKTWYLHSYLIRSLIFFFRVAFVFVVYYLLQDILMRNISKEDRGTCSVFTIGEIFCNNTLIEVVRSRINYS